MRSVVLAALCLALLAGQEKTKSNFDKAAIEAYVRHLLAVIPEVQIKIDDPKPSQISDLQQVDVHFIYGQQSQDETFYITKDGHKIVRGYIYDLGAESVQRRSRKTEDQLVPQLRRRGSAGGVGGVQRFRVPELQRGSQNAAAESAHLVPQRGACLFQGFSDGADSSLGESRRPSRANASSGRIRKPSGSFTTGFTNIRATSPPTT